MVPKKWLLPKGMILTKYLGSLKHSQSLVVMAALRMDYPGLRQLRIRRTTQTGRCAELGSGATLDIFSADGWIRLDSRTQHE